MPFSLLWTCRGLFRSSGQPGFQSKSCVMLWCITAVKCNVVHWKYMLIVYIDQTFLHTVCLDCLFFFTFYLIDLYFLLTPHSQVFLLCWLWQFTQEWQSHSLANASWTGVFPGPILLAGWPSFWLLQQVFIYSFFKNVNLYYILMRIAGAAIIVAGMHFSLVSNKTCTWISIIWSKYTHSLSRCTRYCFGTWEIWFLFSCFMFKAPVYVYYNNDLKLLS